jgi:two-component system, chemotaxis family, sensor kinase CheA
VSRLNLAAYVDLFRTEAREHLGELEGTLLALEVAPAPEHFDLLFRSLHTIKGMAAAMGYREVEQLAHALESRGDPLRAGRETLRPATLALLFEGVDLLRRGVETAGDGGTPADPTPMLARLVADRAGPQGATPAPDQVAAPAVHAPDPVTTPAPTDRVVQVHLTPECPLKGVRALLVLKRLEALGSIRGTEPPQVRWTQDGFTGRFAVTVRSGAGDDALGDAVRAAGDVARVVVRPALGGDGGRGAGMRTVRLDARRLDTLLDLVSELVITRDRLLRQVEGAGDRALSRTAQELGRLVSAMQDEVLHTRLLPVSHVFDRFPRLVRDVAQGLGKEVQLVTAGRDLEVDRSLLDSLADPVVHLLRNAIDHGIEAPDERRRAGKPPAGLLQLSAVRERAGIVVRVRDDGRGIDRDVVLRRARDQGLVPPGTVALDDEGLLRVVAHPGFSTAARVTTVSGRGVGVDVVSTSVRALGGAVALETEVGRGTTFTLRFPVTLAITRALLVRAGGATYAIPATQVLETLELDPAMRVAVRGRTGISLRDEVVPVVVLAEQFGGAPEPRDGEDGPPPLAVVEVGGRRLAVQLDAVLEQRDIVVKPLEAVRGAAPWFSGATLLGDGTPALIVDVASLS